MKNGFRVMDSDLHTMEPDGLWERYLDEPFKRFAPKFIRGTDNAPNQPIIKIGALDIGEMSKRPRTAVVGKDLQRRAFARSPHYDVAHARGYDSASHLQAMDIEGIDVAILYGTRGRQVLMHDDLDPQVADALARAHNNWTHDYCQHDPTRLKFAAQVAFHEPALAAREARRAVRELGAVAVIGNPNPINGRHVHDPELEPLWEAIEELGVPLGFHPTGQSSLRDDIARRYLDHPNGRVIGVAGRNPVELMFAFASMPPAACSSVTRACAARFSKARAAGCPGGSGVWTRRGRSSAPAPRCRSAGCRASTSTGSATSPPTPTSECSGRWWRRSVTTTSSSRPTTRTPTDCSPRPSTSSSRSKA